MRIDRQRVREIQEDFCLQVERRSLALQQSLQVAGLESGQHEGVLQEPSLRGVSREGCSGWAFLHQWHVTAVRGWMHCCPQLGVTLGLGFAWCLGR